MKTVIYKFIGSGLSLLVIILIIFFLGEGILRIYNAFHPVFIFYNDSYNRFRGKPLSYDYDFQLNSKGFKDVEYSEKKENSFRVLGIGDSFTYGVVPYEYNFLTVAEDLISRTAAVAEIINMGIPSTGPKEYLSVLVHEGLDLDPDLIIILFFIGNDFLDSQRKKRPLYTYSYVLSLFKYVFNVRPKFQGSIIHGQSEYNDEWPSMDYKTFLRIERTRSNIYLINWPKFDRFLGDSLFYLRKIKAVCDSSNIDLLVFMIPDEIQINEKIQGDVSRMYSRRNREDFDFTKPNKILAEKLAGEKIKYIDLYNNFSEASRKGDKLYKPHDTHWNIAGNLLAATVISEYILENYQSILINSPPEKSN